jgi:hypothetical protein
MAARRRAAHAAFRDGQQISAKGRQHNEERSMKTVMRAPLRRSLLCVAAAAIGAAAPSVRAAEIGDVTLTWGGYIKLDTLYSHFSDGPVVQGTGRDTYIPNQIPVATGAADDDSHTYLDFHAKETRLFLKADTAVEGHKLGGYLEMDFIVAQGTGNESVTNAYNPGLRRAYITFDNWLLGQDWSTFQNMGAIPEVLDFIAFPTDGTVFERQPMVRYTAGSFVFAIENPESTVATNLGGPSYANTDDANLLPDFVARYNLKASLGDFTIAALARELVDKGQVGGASDKAIGYGASFSGKMPLGASKDDIRFMLNGGDGIGRYLALNTVGDAVIDSDGKLDPVRIFSGYVALRHPWDEKTRSSVGVSYLTSNADSDQLAAGATEKVKSAFVNLLYSPVTKLTVGAELRYAQRETVSSDKGDLMRLQFSAKYSF